MEEEGSETMDEEQSPSSSNQHHIDSADFTSRLLLNNRTKSKDFVKKFSTLKKWLRELNDDEKNLVVKEVLSHCGCQQIHLLSSLLEPRLHEDCPPNCQDPLVSLPKIVANKILSRLDPGKQIQERSTTWKKECSVN